MDFSSERTAVWLPRRTHRSVTSANSRSTKFSQLPLVGVKWTWYRGWRANQARTLATLWGAVVVHYQVDLKTGGQIPIDVVEEPQEFLVPMPPVAVANGHAAGYIQGPSVRCRREMRMYCPDSTQ